MGTDFGFPSWHNFRWATCRRPNGTSAVLSASNYARWHLDHLLAHLERFLEPMADYYSSPLSDLPKSVLFSNENIFQKYFCAGVAGYSFIVSVNSNPTVISVTFWSIFTIFMRIETNFHAMVIPKLLSYSRIVSEIDFRDTSAVLWYIHRRQWRLFSLSSHHIFNL